MSKTILVVDDEAIFLDMMKMVLGDAGYRTHTLLAGVGAFERIAEVQPDLVILDILLPDSLGWDVLEEMRADENTATTPVIICTGAVSEASKLDDLVFAAPNKYSRVQILRKPFDIKQLVQMVEHEIGTSDNDNDNN